jgi:uncharacterized membrane protein YdjX (TVP38/TMEM64 family)
MKKSTALVKMVSLLIFIGVAVYLVRFSPARQYLTADQLGLLLDAAGLWAPLMFVIIYVVGVCLFLPGTLLTALGAALFGPYWGFLYVWTGAMIGAGFAFLIGRYLGRDFAASLIGDRLKRFDDAIERNGFATVLYLRLMYFPFTPMNFGMGLTKVRFWDYIWGTALGILVGTFIFTFFVGTLRDVWVTGRWEELLSWKVYLSVTLFVSSFFIPKLLKMIKREG